MGKPHPPQLCRFNRLGRRLERGLVALTRGAELVRVLPQQREARLSRDRRSDPDVHCRTPEERVETSRQAPQPRGHGGSDHGRALSATLRPQLRVRLPWHAL